jgi:large conductance mechanosensitive channel
MYNIKEKFQEVKNKTPHVKIMREFFEFLKEYKVVALAVGFVMGIASTALVKSLVDNIIMPLVNPLVPAGGWQDAILHIWKFEIKWGAFVGELINFMIIAFVIFLIAKFIMREEKVTKK